MSDICQLRHFFDYLFEKRYGFIVAPEGIQISRFAYLGLKVARDLTATRLSHRSLSGELHIIVEHLDNLVIFFLFFCIFYFCLANFRCLFLYSFRWRVCTIKDHLEKVRIVFTLVISTSFIVIFLTHQYLFLLLFFLFLFLISNIFFTFLIFFLWHVFIALIANHIWRTTLLPSTESAIDRDLFINRAFGRTLLAWFLTRLNFFWSWYRFLLFDFFYFLNFLFFFGWWTRVVFEAG